MQESKIKHVTMSNRYHWALKKYAVNTEKTAKEIIEEALDKMPGFKECLQ